MTKTNWQELIDAELGASKWNDRLSKAIQHKVEELDDKAPKTPVYIPFISVAMLAIVVFLSLNILPELQQGDSPISEEVKFQQVYYSKFPAYEGILNAKENLSVMGMAQTSDPQLLQQLSTAYEEKKEIKQPDLYDSESISVILYGQQNVAYGFNIYKTEANEVIFEQPTSQRYYQYSGTETAKIFELIEKQLNLKWFLIICAIAVAVELLIQFMIPKYYGVKRRKEKIDNITLDRITRWVPVPYIIYCWWKISLKPISLTWWEILIPFIVYQVVVLLLMKREKEPRPYIIEQMWSFTSVLIFIVVLMFML